MSVVIYGNFLEDYIISLERAPRLLEGLFYGLYLGRLDISQKIIGSKLTLKITFAKLRNT